MPHEYVGGTTLKFYILIAIGKFGQMIFGNNFWLKCILHDLFRDTHNAKFSIRCVYLGEPNKVEWGIPEKILQDTAHTHWLWVNTTAQMLRPILAQFHQCNWETQAGNWEKLCELRKASHGTSRHRLDNKAICSGRRVGSWVSQVSQVYRTKKEKPQWYWIKVLLTRQVPSQSCQKPRFWSHHRKNLGRRQSVSLLETLQRTKIVTYYCVSSFSRSSDYLPKKLNHKYLLPSRSAVRELFLGVQTNRCFWCKNTVLSPF